jgi:hypothetical protein
LKRNELTGKSKLVFFKSAFESVEKLSTKDNTEYFDGQKELVSTGNPTPLIGRYRDISTVAYSLASPSEKNKTKAAGILPTCLCPSLPY